MIPGFSIPIQLLTEEVDRFRVIPGFSIPIQLLTEEVDRFRGLGLYVRGDLSAHRQRIYKCECCKVLFIRICSSSHNFYVFGVYRNPDLSANF